MLVSATRKHPTIFHITHWKAGSQWIYKILREVAPERIVVPQVGVMQFLSDSINSSAIYPTIYVTREQFYSVPLPKDFKKFIVIRDLRDTLISAYFSIRYSHPLIDNRLSNWRARLNAVNLQEGLIILMDEWLPLPARIQTSWIEAGENFIRYEDMIENDLCIFEDLLIDFCEIPIVRERLQEIVLANRFEKLTGGRKPGEENMMAHERKGISGDWINYFTPMLSEIFNTQYGSLALACGYELNKSR